MEKAKLDKILDNHKNWLEENGGEKADMCHADLRGADLRGADLRNSCLRYADLRYADLRGGADLSNSDMSHADLRGADLSNSDLRNSCLRKSDLRHANLRGAIISGNLSGADLRHVDLREADLRGATLDYSCFPLWCGGSDFTCDERIVLQLLAHVSTLHFETENIELLETMKLIRKVSKLSHRASELGLS